MEIQQISFKFVSMRLHLKNLVPLLFDAYDQKVSYMYLLRFRWISSSTMPCEQTTADGADTRSCRRQKRCWQRPSNCCVYAIERIWYDVFLSFRMILNSVVLLCGFYDRLPCMHTKINLYFNTFSRSIRLFLFVFASTCLSCSLCVWLIFINDQQIENNIDGARKCFL